MKKPILITFEGIDGSGKTTQAKMLNKYLNKNGVKSLYRHVFDSKAGKLLREIFINNTFSNAVEILILCAARQAYLDENAADEKDYDVVIIDRFFLSILAMQGKNDKDIKLINYLQESICTGRKQSFTFYMNTLPDECKRRLRSRDTCDRIEEKGVEFHEIVYKRYLDLLSNEKNVIIFNGHRDTNSVHQNIVEETLKLLDVIKMK